jgi:sterol desaturase/sphingolipid hydroxylase (fatty acid hydroxylase superfamily)
MSSLLHPHSVLLTLAAMVVRSVVWLGLTAVVFAPLEWLFPVRKDRFLYQGFWTDLGWYFVNSLVTIALIGPPAAAIAFVVHLIVPGQVAAATATLPIWAKMILAMIVGEIGFYWGHRWSHELPLLWRFHSIHHSAEHIHFLVNTRAHPIDMLFTRLCGLTLLFASGLAAPTAGSSDLIIAFVLVTGSLWSYFIHANLRVRLGPLEEILSTPAFHHWHHTREDHKDRNYASMLPIMDRVFGTFYLPRERPAEYGTDTPTPPDVAGQLIAPFASRAPAPEPLPGLDRS